LLGVSELRKNPASDSFLRAKMMPCPRRRERCGRRNTRRRGRAIFSGRGSTKIITLKHELVRLRKVDWDWIDREIAYRRTSEAQRAGPFSRSGSAIYFTERRPRLLDRRIRKSSSFFPDRSCAASQRGCFPRPAHVSCGCSGLRYFGNTWG